MKPTRAFASLLFSMLTVGGAKAAPFVLVSNSNSGTVSVIDAAINTLVTAVPIGGGVGPIAVAPDGSFAFVGGWGIGLLRVIDTSAGVVAATIPIGDSQTDIALTSDGALAYVADNNTSRVWVMDTVSGSVLGEPITVDHPVSLALAPDDSLLYVMSNWYTSTDLISIFDTSTGELVDTIHHGGGCQTEIALSADGALAYVVNACDGTVSVISTSSRTLITRIPTGQQGSQFIAVTQDGRRAYVSNTGSHSVSILDPITRQVVGAPIPVGVAPAQLVITPDEKYVYVANQGGPPCGAGLGTGAGCGSVSVIDAATSTVVATISVGRKPVLLAIAPTFTVVPAPECADGVDNDGDGQVDYPPGYGDPGCDSPADGSERSGALVCDDGLDNDGDGLADYPTDPGCASPSAGIEDPTCNNGIDDDGDGLADFPTDPGCGSSIAESEQSPTLACDDGIDNDFDGVTDYPADLDCLSLTEGLEDTDLDSDGVAPQDNCPLIPNVSQLDSNFDGYGNACDADYDNDGVVGSSDFTVLRRAIGATRTDPEYGESLDSDDDGVIGMPEFELLRSTFAGPPGPSGLKCAATGGCYCQYYGCGF